MMRRCCHLLAWLLFALAARTSAGEPVSAEAAYQKAKAAYHAFKEDAGKKKFRHNWQKIGLMFEQVVQKYPDSKRAADALFSAGRLYQDLYRFSGKKEDLEHSSELLRRLVKEHPDYRLADDAQLLIALRYIEFEKDTKQARAELAFLVDSFPDGDVTPKARRMLEDLGGPPADDSPEVEEIKESPETAAAPKNPPETPKDAVQKQPEKTKPAKTAGKPVLEEIRHWSDAGYTRISLYVQDRGVFKVGTLPPEPANKQPPRLYVDLKDTELGGDVGENIKVGDGVVKRIRVAAREGGFVRVVVDLDKDQEHRVFPLEDPSRVVVDIGGSPQEHPEAPEKAAVPIATDGGLALTATDGGTTPDGGPVAVASDLRAADAGVQADAGPGTKVAVVQTPEKAPSSTTHDKPKPEEPGEKTPVVAPHIPTVHSRPGASLSMLAGLKVKRVVIDPGHGGSDPGAIGAHGTLEKDLTLDLAKRLATLIKENLKLEVVLTRETDRFVALEERTAIANTKRADLFVSIHLNSHRDHRFKGIETYYLDITDDRYSIHLAARENATSEKSISDLQYILADLALKSHVDDSIALSELVQKAVVGSLRRAYKGIRDLGVKHALFYVLLGARMPAILVEASFISNPDEEARMQTKAYRQSLAEAMFTGVKNFIDERERMLNPDQDKGSEKPKDTGKQTEKDKEKDKDAEGE